jgi:hypothetical protein
MDPRDVEWLVVASGAVPDETGQHLRLIKLGLFTAKFPGQKETLYFNLAINLR